MRLRARLLLTTVAVGLPLFVALAWFQYYFAERAREEGLSQFVLTFMQNGGRERCEASPETWSSGPPRRGPPPGEPLSSVGARNERTAPNQDARSEAENEQPAATRLGPPGLPPPPFPGPPDARREHPPRGPRLWAYDSSFHSRNPDAPVIDEELKAALAAGKHATRRAGTAESSFHETLHRMPWGEGPCAFILTRSPSFPDKGWARYLPPARLWLPPMAAVLAGLLIAVGPLIRRVRRLTQEVRLSAGAGYAPAISVGGRDEVGELSRAFSEAGREIHAQLERQQQRERTLREFLDNTTHDVMIPLTVLQGHLTELQQKLAQAPESSVVGSAMGEAHYMASLIHNLAVAAKLEAGEPTFHKDPVDLRPLIERCVARHIPVARQQQISLEHAIPEQAALALGDLTLMEQAVSNVVYNAVRYNRAGGHVAVILETSADQSFVIRVMDDGPGIPQAEMSRLLERHFRGNAARTRAPDGRGIGLNIAFRVAQIHDWDLKLSPSSFGGLQVEFAGKLLPSAQ